MARDDVQVLEGFVPRKKYWDVRAKDRVTVGKLKSDLTPRRTQWEHMGLDVLQIRKGLGNDLNQLRMKWRGRRVVSDLIMVYDSNKNLF